VTASRRAGAIAVAVATIAFGAALYVRDRVDPWPVTAVAAAVSGAVAVWALGRRRLRALFAVSPRGLAAAAAIGLALVAATHLAFAIAAPWLGPHVRELYASIDSAVPRAVQAAITFAVVVVEELVWRGCALPAAGAPRPSPRQLAIAVALYALPQVVGGEWLLVVAALAVGSVFAVQRARTGRLLEPLVSHAIWSLAIFVVVPLAS
jgi:hypothetical protein